MARRKGRRRRPGGPWQRLRARLGRVVRKLPGAALVVGLAARSGGERAAGRDPGRPSSGTWRSGKGAGRRAGRTTRVADLRATPLTPGRPVADLAQALDIGARVMLADAPEGYDVPRDALPGLLASIATAATGRGLGAFVQVPGACLPLTPDTAVACLQRLERRPRFRLLVVEDGVRIAENLAIEVWARRKGAFVATSDRALVGRAMARPPAPGLMTPIRADVTIPFPIDAVYTWVNGADPGWQELFARFAGGAAMDPDRFAETDELRYSLRSIEVFAPWFRRVHILSNCPPPAWFRPTPRIAWVDHAEAIDADVLPLFGSTAIETFLHRIPGLSEHFVYLNDDTMLWDSVDPGMFFTRDGRGVAHLAPARIVPYIAQRAAAGHELRYWQSSRLNAARLLEERSGVLPTRLHQHVPVALRRSVMEELEREYPDEMAAVRAARVRDPATVGFVALLYHHHAHRRGLGVVETADAAEITLRLYRRHRVRRALTTASFVCFNEGAGSGRDEAFQAFKRSALEAALPIPSSAEVSPGTGAGPAPSAG